MPTTGLLVGAGSIGKRHAKVMADRYSTLHIVDPSEQSRAWATETFGSQVVTHDNLDGALTQIGSADVTAVVATLGPVHRDNVSSLIEHGVRRIYCEKPFASSIADGHQLADLAERTSTRVIVGLQRRYSTLVDQILQFARDHLGGEPVSIVGHGGAQCLITTGMHWVDLGIDLFKGFPSVVSGLGSADRMNPRGTDLDVWQGTAVWQFSSGRLLTLTYSNHTSVDGFLSVYCPRGRVDICPDGVIRAFRRDDAEVDRDPRVTRTGEAFALDAQVFVPPTVHPVARALDELESDRALTYATRDAARSLECALAALVAFESKQTVSLPVDPTSEYYSRQWAVT
ncbi:MAG: Gfo/Idh/MocA family protein [Ilumatobacteraceae bacterium]